MISPRMTRPFLAAVAALVPVACTIESAMPTAQEGEVLFAANLK